VQLFYHGAEAAASFIQVVKTDLRGRRFFTLVSLVHRFMPYFPSGSYELAVDFARHVLLTIVLWSVIRQGGPDNRECLMQMALC
jgi:hypothetical protein